jgi:hypothetical protein
MLVVATHGPDSPRIYYYSGGITIDTNPDWSVGPPFQYSHYLPNPGNFGFIDWNGDGWQDIYVGWHADLDTTSFIAIYFGPDFPDQPDRTIWTPLDSGINDPEAFARFVSSVGDIEGDGYEDLAVESYDRMLIYSGGPTADTLLDYRQIPRSECAAAAGDVNGDGDNDLLLGLSYRHAQRGIEVLLGGTEWDESSDGKLIRSDLPPYFLDQIGYRIASAGDFNGDGYDDMLFSTLNLTSDDVGDIFVAAGGIDIITGVEGNHDNAQRQQLLEVFPNPTNLSVSIRVTLRRSAQASLCIYNVLGHKVSVILPGTTLTVGSHLFAWDGKLQNGLSCPSGVYFCRLEFGDQSLTRKLLLLK